MEGYFANVVKLNYLRLQDYILFPLGIHIEGENQVNLIVPRKLSLYEILHSGERKISLPMKISICLRIARILNTLHGLTPPIAHGSLSSHNFFLDLDFEDDCMKPYKLYLGELELHDFKKYANMFSEYRCASVWSPPESLKQPRKKLDPTP